MTASEYQRLVLHRDLWSLQKRICHAVERYSMVSVKGCHGSGKTYDTAGIALWWYQKHEDGVVLWIAPTMRQVKLGIDSIALAAAGSPQRWPEITTTGLRRTRENYIQGFSAARAVNAQGFHGKNILIVCDESPGIQTEVWDAIEGVRSSGNVKLLKLGNPVIPSGPFYNDFGIHKKDVYPITISAFDTPNLHGCTIEMILMMNDVELDTVAVKAPLVRRRWVKEMYYKWGPAHPSYQSRVLGQFPAQSKFAVFSSEWVTVASRELEEQHWKDLKAYDGIIQIGLDVAGAGEDETAACARAGQIVIRADQWVDAEPKAAVSAWIGGIKRDFPRSRVIVSIDSTGVGYFLGQWLGAEGLEVYGQNFGSAASDPAFLNLKAQMYWTLGEWMKRGIYGVTDLDTHGQLIGCQYEPMPSGPRAGAIKVEDKATAKKRGQSSPDRAEALVLAFAPIVIRDQRLTVHELTMMERLQAQSQRVS